MKEYVSPTLTIINICVEKGYAASVPIESAIRLSDPGCTNTEERTVSTNWSADNDEGFWNNGY